MTPGADAQCPGLRYVPKTDISGRWVRRYKTTVGKMKQYTFGEYPAVSLDEAREYVDRVRGQDNPIVLTAGEPTIGVLIDRYLQEYIKAQRTPGAQATVRSALVRNLKPIATKKLQDVNAAMLHELIMTVKKRAPTMAQLMRSELKQAWSYGLSIGMTSTVCPITSLTGGRFTRRARDRILTDAELPLIIDQLAIYTPQLADVIRICLYTGLRSGEVIATHAREFETDSHGILWLTIPARRMKTKMAHRVPFFGAAAAVWNERTLGNSGFLFPMKRNPSQHIKQVTLAREVYSTAGPVGYWHLHDLRRTTRTNLQRIGCPFEVSETILAHKLPGVSAVYARYQYNDEKIKWLMELADYYDKLT